MPTSPAPTDDLPVALVRYRPWFYAAALYNLLWGAAIILFPRRSIRLLGLPETMPVPLWQVIGMLVMVYAPGYFWAARHPERHRQLVLIGMVGKACGPIGFAWSATRGDLPRSFGLTILTNDLLWWPAFIGYLRLAAKQPGGWPALLRGE
jgi:small multidrug resistance pump